MTTVGDIVQVIVLFTSAVLFVVIVGYIGFMRWSRRDAESARRFREIHKTPAGRSRLED